MCAGHRFPGISCSQGALVRIKPAHMVMQGLNQASLKHFLDFFGLDLYMTVLETLDKNQLTSECSC